MNQQQGPRIRIVTRQTSLIERVVLFALGLVILVAAFFFIGIALIAGAILAGVVLIRLWWLQRKLRRKQEESYVEGEYTVVDTSVTDQRPPSDRRP
ncbi:MAG: hypothetical protein H6R21_925 [Proteobacteria bacterium]|nr:hypothetical protein [Pseudomonadota bacterium]RPJ44636.1 MAG: hypothetical protein EHM16_15020 [Betaproteobacteria bacterium]